MHRPLALLLPAGLAACYAPHSFRTLSAPFLGQRLTVGCLDVAATLTDDAVAPGTVVAYSFGNSCAHQTIVDFTALHVVGYDAGGHAVPLVPRDPGHELRPLQLDAWSEGTEAISYAYAEGAPGAASSQRVCIAFDGFDAGAKSAAPQYRCLGAGGAL